MFFRIRAFSSGNRFPHAERTRGGNLPRGVLHHRHPGTHAARARSAREPVPYPSEHKHRSASGRWNVSCRCARPSRCVWTRRPRGRSAQFNAVDSKSVEIFPERLARADVDVRYRFQARRMPPCRQARLGLAAFCGSSRISGGACCNPRTTGIHHRILWISSSRAQIHEWRYLR